MNKIELTDNELENILELITSNNQYNDDSDTIDFWNCIVRKLDPDRRFTFMSSYQTKILEKMEEDKQ